VLGAYNFNNEGDLATCLKYLREALKIGVELNDIVTVLLSNYWMGLALAWHCEFEKALPLFERALEINMAVNSLWGMSSMKSNIAWQVYANQGKCDLAYQTGQEAVQLAEESGDTYSKAQAYTSHGFAGWTKGFLDEAEQHLLKGADYCDRINLLAWAGVAYGSLGRVYYDKGEYQKSQDYHNKAISVMKRGRISPSFVNYNRVGLARAKVMSNEKDIDLKDIFESYHANRQKVIAGAMAEHIGEILLNIDDRHMDEAEGWVKKAIEADESNSLRLYLGLDYASYAELLRRKGDLPGAREKLNTAIEIYRECGADGWLKKAQGDLAAIEKPGRKQSKRAKG